MCVSARIYREVMYDFLEQSGIGQQLAMERRVLQQHREDLSELRQLFLVQIANAQQLQNYPQQARNAAQCCHTSTPNCFPANCQVREMNSFVCLGQIFTPAQITKIDFSHANTPFVVAFSSRLLLHADEQSKKAEAALGQKAQHGLKWQDGQIQ